MFTGLIESIGTIRRTEALEQGGRQIWVEASDTLMTGAAIGDSIAVEGVCTTITQIEATTFALDASPETLTKTTLNALRPGQPVNLERPVCVGDRLGGHIVTGHVDAVGHVAHKRQDGNSWIFRVHVADPAHMPLLVEKGSVTLSGISLTVNTVDAKGFTVAIIPHTLEQTTMGQLSVGDPVNLEFDILGKYVQRLMQPYGVSTVPNESNRSVDPVRAHGVLPVSPPQQVGRSTVHTGAWFNMPSE